MCTREQWEGPAEGRDRDFGDMEGMRRDKRDNQRESSRW